MKESVELRQRWSTKVEEYQKILDTAKAEKRGLSEEEKTTLDGLRSEIEGLKADIERAEFAEEQQREMANIQKPKNPNPGPKGGEQKERSTIISEFRFTKAIRAMMPNGKLEGLEKEMHEEATREASAAGKSIMGVGVPSFFMDNGQRDLTATGTATQGGNTVPTIMRDFIGPLRTRLKVRELGATIIDNLTGNIEIPRQTSVTAATWEGENDANAESQPSLDKATLSPNRLGATTDVSKQLIVQSSLAIEQLVRNDLSIAVSNALDLAAINGSGSSSQPEGILNVTGIGSVAIGATGGAPTRDHLISLWKEIAVDNADQGALAFLTTPGVKAKLMQTKTDAGSGIFVWPEGMNSLVGYRAETSTQVPSDLTKSTGTDLNAIIFGHWRDLLIGQWAGLDLVVDPYTKATTALVALTINSWWDIAVRHPESFAAIVDADIT